MARDASIIGPRRTPPRGAAIARESYLQEQVALMSKARAELEAGRDDAGRRGFRRLALKAVGVGAAMGALSMIAALLLFSERRGADAGAQRETPQAEARLTPAAGVGGEGAAAIDAFMGAVRRGGGELEASARETAARDAAAFETETEAEIQPEAGASETALAPPAAQETLTTASSETAAPPPGFVAIDAIRIGVDGSVTLVGRAEPGATVTLLVDGETASTAVADANGVFETVVSAAAAGGLLPPLAPLRRDDPAAAGAGWRSGSGLGFGAGVGGPRAPARNIELRSGSARRMLAAAPPPEASESGRGGGAESGAPPPAVVEIDERFGGAPLDGGALGGGWTAARDGQGSLSIDGVAYGADGAAALSGRAEPSARLRVRLDDAAVMEIEADAEGSWRAALPADLPPALYTVVVERLGDGGAVEERAETPFEQAPPEDLVAPGGAVVVQPGANLWRIAARVYGDGARYVAIHRRNEGVIVDPDLIYPGQVLALPQLEDGD